MLESYYQKKLKAKLRASYPGCLILKNDEQLCPGIPDLVIFYRDRYAFLEVKAEAKSSYRPNQEIYLKRLDEMSFAATIYPENERVVLSALQEAFGA